VWVAIAASLGLLGGIAWFMTLVLVGGQAPVLIGFLTGALVTAGLWLATVTAQRGWSRGLLGVFAMLVLVLGSWAWLNFLQADKQSAAAGCELIRVDFLARYEPERVASLPAGTELTEMDPVQCARIFDDPQLIYADLLAQIDGDPPMYIVDLHRILWAVFVVLWIFPPVLAFFLRRRLRWNP